MNIHTQQQTTFDIPWLQKFIQKAPHIRKVSTLVFYYGKIDDWIINHQHNIINYFIQQLNTNELSLTLLIGIPRLIFRAKNSLPYWDTYLENTRQELENRNEDYEYLLRGLYE